MNKKYISILIICSLITVLCMGLVCAKSMQTQDFYSFKIDTPNGSNFVKEEIEIDEDNIFPGSQEAYVDEQNQIMIYYIDSPIFAGENNAIIYHALFSTLNPDANQSYEYQEDNLRVIETVTESEMNLQLVGLTSGNETILLIGTDVDLLKDMAHTVEF
ncbi:hypothetical protein [uncultured Methanobrevibacter sp.]|uniref:hypothetical protein n=1 Tax=uncultured Methanobrevibacter sp. TaxID=253161 RepID=UPI002632839E|nr:hypothetical protein [uncultured Methanobrevibacter sp.]